MKITGVAPKIAVPTFLYLIVTAVVDARLSPLFKMKTNGYTVLLSAGILLILFGIGMIVTVARQLLVSFKSETLMTDGLFSLFRNPMYAAYLLCITPGIALILNSWLVLSTVVVNFILIQLYIGDEYKYLSEKFGEDYKSYLSKVRIKFL